MKIIDTAKDTHITHLLKQTDAYLDSLAHAQDHVIRLGHDVLLFHDTQRKRPVLRIQCQWYIVGILGRSNDSVITMHCPRTHVAPTSFRICPHS